MGVSVGTSVIGRQFLGEVSPGPSAVVLELLQSPLVWRRSGVLAFEILTEQNVPVQIASYSLWYGGYFVPRIYANGIPVFTVCYWQVADIPWRTTLVDL